MTRTKPIKIGGGTDNGEDRIVDYLETLLGLHGEIITFNQNESVIHDGAELNVYNLRIGNIFRTLYFDTTTFEELRIPIGITCSGPLPEAP